MAHHLITAEHLHLLFDRDLAPVLRVKPGETVTFQTLDACWGDVRSREQFLHYRQHNPRGGSNPLTGPVFVEGAAPGGCLVVEILDIELAAEGFQLIGPQRGVIRDEVSDWEFHLVRIEQQKLRLPGGLTLPIEPVVGQLGSAPARTPTNKPNPCGGNLDVPQIGIGATVYLPIEVPGAIFSVGDLHARQGDGELVGAPEIGGRVKIRFDVRDRARAGWPVVERADQIIVCASAPTEFEAIRAGTFEAARLLEREHGFAFNEALLFLTMTAQVRYSRAGHWGDHDPVIALSMSRKLIGEAYAEDR
jgi:amidase